MTPACQQEYLRAHQRAESFAEAMADYILIGILLLFFLCGTAGFSFASFLAWMWIRRKRR